MKIGLIGTGAIANYVRDALASRDETLAAVLVRPARVQEAPDLYVAAVAELPADLDLVIDCAGHAALVEHGPAILRRGFDLMSVSLGALADPDTHAALEQAAKAGQARLHLVSGAIGALDCLQAARIGMMENVTYVGRKPPKGWKGSPAEDVVDLDTLVAGEVVHFEGTARQAALRYPKNANVAAAVALAGKGFDATQVRLIADAEVTENIHQIEAAGAFGRFTFQINGKSMPDNPRSSALAAMSVLSKLDQLTQPITL